MIYHFTGVFFPLELCLVTRGSRRGGDSGKKAEKAEDLFVFSVLFQLTVENNTRLDRLMEGVQAVASSAGRNGTVPIRNK